MGITTYNPDWQKEFPWLRAVDGDKFSAYCMVCFSKFKIDNQGKSQVTSHAKCHETNSRKKEALQKFLTQPQRTFTSSPSGNVGLSANKAVLSSEDRVTSAEIIDALHLVQYNQSFTSVNGNAERYVRMFGADNPIINGYRMGETKVAYMINHGIAFYLKKKLVEDVSDTPYSFLFDETTTSQVKKQYDGYLLYWSRKDGRVVHSYCGSIFVGHCLHEDLVNHYQEFADQFHLNSGYLLHFGMDGPNVNLAFENKMSTLLSQSNTGFLKLGSCSLHPVHTAFANGIKKLFVCYITVGEKTTKFDLDDFFQDLHFFFKKSAARREDYKSLEKLTGVIAEYMKRHAETRWVSMKYVALRCVEQWSNLTEYFLKYLPKQKNFKREIQNTHRYIRIKTALGDEATEAYASFCAFVAHDFESFLVPFQTSEPLIHQLHPALCKLLYDLQRKFVKQAKLNQDIAENIFIDANKSDNQKSLKNIDVGTKALCIIKDLTPEKATEFRQNCLKFYTTACTYLQNNLPYDNAVIKYAQYLHPEKRSSPQASNAVANLAHKVTAVLGDDCLHKVFQVGEGETRESIVDKVRNQWKFYQNEEIPEEWYIMRKSDDISRRNQESYWKKAEELLGLKANAPEKRYKRIDEYWAKIGSLTDDAGNLKYLQLFCLVKCVLSLSHGNSIPERGFSINKQMLNVHGYSTSEHTIVSLRFVKDELHRVGGEAKFRINRELLDDVKGSFARYESDRIVRQAAKEKEDKERRKQEEEESSRNVELKKLQKIEEEIEACKMNIQVASDLIDDANTDLGTALNEKVIKRDLVQQASSKLTVGTERKRKFEEDLVGLEKQKAKVSKKLKR